jgi:pseudomonalisin
MPMKEMSLMIRRCRTLPGGECACPERLRMLSRVRIRFLLLVAVFAFVFGLFIFAHGQTPARRIGPIDENQVVTLTGNVHPLARAEFDLGTVAGETVLERMMLELEPSPAQQAELDALVEAQHGPHSPLYQQWLTPAEYGARFGASAADVARICAWLSSHGFTVDEVAASIRLIQFSGTAAQFAETFHTEIHRYKVDGAEHMANVQDPQIPAAFAGVIGGVVSLNDFRRKSEIASKRAVGQDERPGSSGEKAAYESRTANGARPDFTDGSTHYLFPADWAEIYDLKPLYSAGTNGTGSSIAIVGRSNINLADVSTFRSTSGLGANQPAVILVSTNPGLVSGDQDESTLDVEWSGAVAPAATVKFVVGASTALSDGVDLSAQYIVNHATAPVMSTSYGACEQDIGSGGMAFYNSLWEQAASEGISAFVSSGDSGAAGCDGGSATKGTIAAVNGLCSSPYSTCVGGTEFNEGSKASQYWSASNASGDESALGYIPEEVWNESGLDGGSGLWSSTGGASVIFSQPSWQKGVAGANAANGMRAVPDVAMTASGHDGYIIVEDGSFWVIAGTSAASPSFAGLMSLVVEQQGGKGQGNANPQLYALLSAAKNPFHATPSGNNTVPGVTGFTASGIAYNLATGLGSVDGAVLAESWSAPAKTPSTNFALTSSATAGTVAMGKTATFTIAVTESGSANALVGLVAKAPAGVAAGITPTSVKPGTLATVVVTVGSKAAVGAQSITITGSDSSGTQTVTYELTVPPPPALSVTAASTSASVAQGSASTDVVTIAGNSSYAGPVTLSLSGLPAGVKAAWSSSPFTLIGGSGTSILTLQAASTATVGSATITVTASGDGVIATKQITLHVTQGPGIEISLSASAITMAHTGSGSVNVTLTELGGINVPTSLAITGQPAGVTFLMSGVIGSPGENASGLLTFTGSSKAKAGTSTVTFITSCVNNGVTYTAKQTLTLQLK